MTLNEDRTPALGDTVLYVLPASFTRSAGQLRPGIVVRVWTEAEAYPAHAHAVQLQVFLDGRNDAAVDAEAQASTPNTHWACSVIHDETMKPGTWHWPEQP